ncbi:MAG: gliding motility-associated protein GldE [Bacteroidia bacterium]|nr:gliding motility-associated protein GldE [Bacteroidia bacterium]
MGYYLLSAVVLLLLLGLSAAISGSEIALFSLSLEEQAHCREQGTQAEQTAVSMLEKPQLLLATILIFNNLVNVSFVTFSTFITWDLTGTKTPEGYIILVLTVLVTLVLLFLGELLPKVYATQYNLAFIRRTVYIIYVAFFAFRPLSYLLVSMSNVIERRVKKRGYRIHLEELPEFIDEMSLEGRNPQKEKEILKGIVNFGTISVGEIMTSRLAISAFDINMPFPQLLKEIRKCGYSRIPIYRDTIDRIEGILYVKDLLPFLEMHEDFKWNKLLRPRYFVPQNKRVDKLLRDFQEKHVHLAIVVDEYGGTAGLITMEDIIEEIVGEINDEFDESKEKMYTQIDEQTFLFEGKIPLQDFTKVMGVEGNMFDEIKGESKSLGGLMLEKFSRFPELNEEVTYDKFLFTVVSVSTKKIKVVKVQILEKIN